MKPIGSFRTVSEEVFSETRIQPCESLFNRTGAKRRFAPRWTQWASHLATRLDRYSRIYRSNPKNLRHQLERRSTDSCCSGGMSSSHYPTAPKASGGILVALRELQYYLVSCIPAQFYLFGARRRRDSYLLGLLRLFLRLFLPKLSAIRVARFNSVRSYDPKKNRYSHERLSTGSCCSYARSPHCSRGPG